MFTRCVSGVLLSIAIRGSHAKASVHVSESFYLYIVLMHMYYDGMC